MAASDTNTLNRSPDGLKVFISYSRADMGVADALVDVLEANGIEVTIDRRDLPYGEEWQAELADFIRASDTVVWLVSRNSLRSKWCHWELGEVVRLKKRLVPIVIEPVSTDDLPEALGSIHLLPAQGAFSLDSHLQVLIDTLNTDRAWVKEHTRLADRARQWTAKDRTPALLLRGTALKDAEAWSDRSPRNAPSASDDILELMLASRRAATRRQRYWVTGSVTVMSITAILAVFAYVQKQVAETNAYQARSTLALSDFSKASEQAPAAPTRALAHLARAIRNDPDNAALGRRTLYLLAEHAHVVPLSEPLKNPPPLARPRVLSVERNADGVAASDELASPDGTWLVTLGDEKVSIRNKGVHKWQTIEDESYLSFRMATFSENSRYFATCAGGGGEYGFTGKVRIIDGNGSVLAEKTFNGVKAKRVALSPNGQLLVVTLVSSDANDGQSRTVIYDLPASRRSDDGQVRDLGFSELRVIPGEAKRIGFSADGNYLLLDDQWLRIWRSIADEPFPHGSPEAVVYTPDSSYMAVSGKDEPWTVFDTTAGRKLSAEAAPSGLLKEKPRGLIGANLTAEGLSVFHDKRPVFRANDQRVILVGINDALDRLLFVRDDETAQAVSIADGALGSEWQPVEALYGLSPPMAKWAIQSAGELRRPEILGKFLAVTEGAATSWRLLYVAPTADEAKLERVLQSLSKDQFGTANYTAALHPDGRLAAIAQMGHSRAVVKVIDVLTNELVLDPFVVDDQEVDLFFSRDGNWLAAAASSSGSALGRFRVIDVATGLPLMRQRLYAGPFVQRPDGRRVAVLGGSGDDQPFLFDVLGENSQVPLWVADLAEGIAGRHLDERNVLRDLTAQEQAQRMESVRAVVQGPANKTNRWIEFARWYLADDPDAAISPYSALRRSGVEERLRQTRPLPPPLEWNREPPPGAQTQTAPLSAPAPRAETQPPAAETPGNFAPPPPPIAPLVAPSALPGGFVAVVASLEQRQTAMELASVVRQKAGDGLGNRSVRVHETIVGNKRYFRVLVEPSSSRTQAEELCNLLRLLGFKGCFLVALH